MTKESKIVLTLFTKQDVKKGKRKLRSNDIILAVEGDGGEHFYIYQGDHIIYDREYTRSHLNGIVEQACKALGNFPSRIEVTYSD